LAGEFQKLRVPIVISVLFFMFGSFVTAQALDMSLREIMIGLFAGAAGGIAMLVATLHQNDVDAVASARTKLTSGGRP
jgi:hypothetical protein